MVTIQKSQRQKAGATKQVRSIGLIVDTAQVLLCSEPRRLTAIGICERAGLSTATFYAHFKSADEVALMVASEALDHVGFVTSDYSYEHSPRETLVYFVDTLQSKIGRSLVSFIHCYDPATTNPLLRELSEIFRTLLDYFEEENLIKHDLDTKSLSLMSICAMIHMIVSNVLSTSKTKEFLVGQVTNSLGIRC